MFMATTKLRLRFLIFTLGLNYGLFKVEKNGVKSRTKLMKACITAILGQVPRQLLLFSKNPDCKVFASRDLQVKFFGRFLLRKPFLSIANLRKKLGFDGARCPLIRHFSRGISQGDHHRRLIGRTVRTWCQENHFFPRAFKQKKFKALRPKMTKIVL